MTSLSPSEIQSRYPIGAPIELSHDVRFRAAFLEQAIRWVTFIPESYDARFKAQEGESGIDRKEAMAFLEDLAVKHPAKAMFSTVAGNGWNNPMASVQANQTKRLLSSLMWALIYEDLVNRCGMTKQVWRILNLSVATGAQAVVVKGYNFSDADLDITTSSEKSEIPDSPPHEMLGEE